MNYETQFIVIINIFRHHMHMKKTRKKKINNVQLDVRRWRKQEN